MTVLTGIIMIAVRWVSTTERLRLTTRPHLTDMTHVTVATVRVTVATALETTTTDRTRAMVIEEPTKTGLSTSSQIHLFIRNEIVDI